MRRLSTDSDLGRRSALPENSAGRERLSLSQGGMSMSHRSNLELQPHLLSVVLESAWTTMLQNCLNVSGALLMVRAPCHFAHCALPSSMLSPCWIQCGWSKMPGERAGLRIPLAANDSCRSAGPPTMPPFLGNAESRGPTFSPRLSRWSNRPWCTYNLDSVRLAQSPVKPLLHRYRESRLFLD